MLVPLSLSCSRVSPALARTACRLGSSVPRPLRDRSSHATADGEIENPSCGLHLRHIFCGNILSAPVTIWITMAVIEVDGSRLEVLEGTPLINALQSQGYSISRFPEDPGLFMPCRTGGCWACAVEADGRLRPACVLTVRDGMTIRTNPSHLVPKRLVGGFMGHGVGGVGTPWRLKGRYIEAACFTAGCNFLCPQCQNWSFVKKFPYDLGPIGSDLPKIGHLSQ